MTRKARVLLVIGLLLIVLTAVSAFGVVQAQQIVGVQQWQYAVLMYNLKDNTYGWNTSQLFDQMDQVMPAANTQAMFDAMEGQGNLVDCLAIMGLSGYELVDVTPQANGQLLVHTFKRPIT